MDSCTHSGIRWLLHSGIQSETGAVFSEYQALTRSYSRVSAESAGWYIQALLTLEGDSTGERLEHATKAGQFMMERGFDLQSDLFVSDPSVEQPQADFSSCVVMLRALSALWKASGDAAFKDCADRGARSVLLRLGRVDGSFFPHFDVNQQQPQGERAGLEQLKSAQAFLELSEDLGLSELGHAAELLLKWAMGRREAMLTQTETSADPLGAWRRYALFLEGLLPFVTERMDIASALQAGVLRLEQALGSIDEETRPPGAAAQLLRLRLFADLYGVVELDRASVEQEAAALAEYQLQSPDPSIDGAFAPRRDATEIGAVLDLHASVVCLQALEFWNETEESGFRRTWRDLI